MLRSEIVGALVLDCPALRGLGELVFRERLGHLHQVGIALHGVGARLASGLGQLGGVRKADLALRNRSASLGQLGQLRLSTHIAGSLRTRPSTDLVQQPCAAVAVALSLSDHRSSFGLKQLDTRAQRLRQPKRATQFPSRRRLGAVEGCGEAFERLLHLREHTFTLASGCYTRALI